ncbi:hypothetical protein EST38_g5419 [Candolleomyces aberdarensis]|uniref:Uncharacterized protein n=1 Tax=Candolleomyces aberdarensis TaxID=2316362 RepID=A0A4Q2DMJ0_9AGAR|nr:hypothetical protein EST38_g5419 [Candolleomyces aberdarensis]
MKLHIVFAALTVLLAETVFALPLRPLANDLARRDQFIDVESDDVLTRELLDYGDEFEIGSREDTNEEPLYARVPVYGMRMDPLKMAKNTGESRLQNVMQNILDQKFRQMSKPDRRVVYMKPAFSNVAWQAHKQNQANKKHQKAMELAKQNFQRKLERIRAGQAKRK